MMSFLQICKLARELKLKVDARSERYTWIHGFTLEGAKVFNEHLLKDGWLTNGIEKDLTTREDNYYSIRFWKRRGGGYL